jgi:chemotaxis protein methyltransferase CheR
MFGWFKRQKVSEEPAAPEIKTENFTDPKKILDHFTAITGIHFNEKESITRSKLIHFCRNYQLYTFDELYERLMRDGSLLEALINTLTVNETYFFRETRQIDFVAERAYRAGQKVRILCAPGSTGEEPYSIAIALLERGISPLMIEIVSLDINSDVVMTAKEGRYTERSLHKTTPELKEKYFYKEGHFFRIQESVKALVRFHTLNIFDDQLFALGKFDVVFSRNMLIYFDEATVIRAVERLGRMANRSASLFLFGHADFVKTPPNLMEHYEEGIKYYTLR